MAGLLPRETETPGLRPPPGVLSDFVHPYSLAKYAIVAHTAGLTVSTLFVLMRMYTKVYITRSPGWDDYTSIFAWLFSIAYSGVGLPQINYGLGVHEWNVPLSKVIRFRQLSNVEQIMYPPLTFIIKVSILLLYYRIFSPNRRVKLLIFSLVPLLFLFYTANMLVKVFLCIPRRKIWDKSVDGHCVDVHSLFLSSAVVNVISDFYILVLPIPSIWKLHVPLRRKIGVMAAFSAGLFACIASLMRLVETVRHAGDRDETWSIFSIHLWTVAEVSVGIICSCLPALPSFYHHFFPRQSLQNGSYFKDSFTSRKTDPSAISDPEDPRFVPGKYVELEESRNLQDGPYMGTQNSYRAEARRSSTNHHHNGNPTAGAVATAAGSTGHKNLEIGTDGGGGILRTIDVEQSISGPALTGRRDDTRAQ